MSKKEEICESSGLVTNMSSVSMCYKPFTFTFKLRVHFVPCIIWGLFPVFSLVHLGLIFFDQARLICLWALSSVLQVHAHIYPEQN